MNIRNIADYLDQMQEGQLESSGQFTLDWTKALEKLGRYQNEAAGFWVIKFLQAAVSSGAPSFTIKQTRRKSLLSFRPSLPANKIVAALQSLERSKLPALAHLQAGVQALSFVPGCKHRLHLYRDGQKVSSYALSEGRLGGEFLQAPAKHCSLEFEREWDRPLGFFSDFGASRRYSEENLFLQEMGRFAPIEVRVDRRLINAPVANKPPGLRLGVPVPILGARPYAGMPFTLLERIVLTDATVAKRMALLNHFERKPGRRFVSGRREDSGGAQAYWQEWVHPQRNFPDSEHLRKYLSSSGGSLPRFTSKVERADQAMVLWPDYDYQLPAVTVQGYLSIDLYPGDEGRLYIVKDGVVLKPCNLGPRFKGCLAIWSEPEVNTDISQLQVVQDEVYQDVVECITDHYEDSARQLLRNEERKVGLLSRLLSSHCNACLDWAERFLEGSPT